MKEFCIFLKHKYYYTLYKNRPGTLRFHTWFSMVGSERWGRWETQS